MVEASKSIPGRGGATLCHLSSDEQTHNLLLLFGADRTQQHHDIWRIEVDRATYAIKQAKQIDIKERDNFTTRNSMAAVSGLKGEPLFFGGIQSETGQFHNELYTVDQACTHFTHIAYKEGDVSPAPRNSHTFS